MIFVSFQFLGHRSDLGQSAMHAYDNRTGVIFFSQVSTNAIACWNTAKPLTEKNIGIIARDDTCMLYPSDINVSLVFNLQIFDHFSKPVFQLHADRRWRYHLGDDKRIAFIQLRTTESKRIQLSHLETVSTRCHSKYCVRCRIKSRFKINNDIRSLTWPLCAVFSYSHIWNW